MWLRYYQGPWLVSVCKKPNEWNETDITRRRKGVLGISMMTSPLWEHHGSADRQHMFRLQYERTGFGWEFW